MSKLSDPELQFHVPRTAIEQTLEFLQEQGRRDHEGVVLWAGRLSQDIFRIIETVIPEQYTSPLSFRIPNGEMFRLVQWRADRNVVFGVQVHSHPEEAFHSEADDAHCILSHRGAVSIVLPDFADVPREEFFTRAAVYTLRTGTEWNLLDSATVVRRFQMVVG